MSLLYSVPRFPPHSEPVSGLRSAKLSFKYIPLIFNATIAFSCIMWLLHMSWYNFNVLNASSFEWRQVTRRRRIWTSNAGAMAAAGRLCAVLNYVLNIFRWDLMQLLLSVASSGYYTCRGVISTCWIHQVYDYDDFSYSQQRACSTTELQLLLGEPQRLWKYLTGARRQIRPITDSYVCERFPIVTLSYLLQLARAGLARV